MWEWNCKHQERWYGWYTCITTSQLHCSEQSDELKHSQLNFARKKEGWGGSKCRFSILILFFSCFDWVSLEYMKKFYIWFEATEYTHAFTPRTKILSVCQTRWTNYKTKIHWSLISFSSGMWNRLCQVLPWWKKRGLTLGLKKKWRNI